jgi:hypothetical protein
MKVKVGDKVYDSEDEPVMVIVDDNDKEHIGRMLGTTATKYCCCPKTDEWRNVKKVREWMKGGIDG